MTRWGSSGIPHAMSPFISPTVTTVEWGDAQTTASVTHRHWGAPGRLGATALGGGEPGQASVRRGDQIRVKAESPGGDCTGGSGGGSGGGGSTASGHRAAIHAVQSSARRGQRWPHTGTGWQCEAGRRECSLQGEIWRLRGARCFCWRETWPWQQQLPPGRPGQERPGKSLLWSRIGARDSSRRAPGKQQPTRPTGCTRLKFSNTASPGALDWESSDSGSAPALCPWSSLLLTPAVPTAPAPTQALIHPAKWCQGARPVPASSVRHSNLSPRCPDTARVRLEASPKDPAPTLTEPGSGGGGPQLQGPELLTPSLPLTPA